MTRPVTIAAVLALCGAAGPLPANPIPFGVPYITMTTEDMDIVIEGDCARFEGRYDFALVYAEDPWDPVPWEEDPPPWTLSMAFPVPPDATAIRATFNDREIAHAFVERQYLTTLPQQIPGVPAEYCIWPTVSWSFVLDEAQRFTVGISYDQPLLPVGDDGLVFCYSLGTGRYVDGWSPPILELGLGGKPYLDVYLDIDFDPDAQGVRLHSVWGDPEGWGGSEMRVEVGAGHIHAEAHDFSVESDFVVLFRAQHAFLRGDANEDGRVDIADPVRMLGALFLEERLGCRDAADGNDDGRLDVADAIYLLNHLFARGPAPPPPFPAPSFGPDTTPDDLGCMRYEPAGPARPACPGGP